MALMTLVVLSFTGCKKSTDKPFPNNNNGGGNGGEKEIVVDSGLKASILYYGDYYGTGFHDYILLLQNGEIVDNNGQKEFLNSGTELCLEILSSSQSDATYLAAGKYALLDEGVTNAAGIVASVKTTDDKGNISYGNTYLYTQADKNNCYLEPIDAVTLTVRVDGSVYTLVAAFEVDGYTYSYTYEGALVFTDKSEEDGPEGDYDFKARYVLASNEGHAWNNSTDDWIVLLEGEDTNEMLQIEFVGPTGNDRGSIPTGTYIVPADFLNAAQIQGGTLCPFYTQDNSSGGEDYFGTYLQEGNIIWYEAKSGSLTVEQTAEGYIFKLIFVADYDGNPHVTCTYSGAVDVDTSSYVEAYTQDVRKKSVKLAEITDFGKNSVVRRNAHRATGSIVPW